MIKQKNKKYWNEIADIYDSSVGDKGDRQHEKVINPIVLKLLGDVKNKIVLDAGCGNGYLAGMIAKKAKKVIGVDFTDRLIDLAKDKLNLKNLKFFVSDIKKLSFPDNYFDLVLCNMVLMDINCPLTALRELSRVIKKKGILVVSIIHPCFENPPMTYSIIEELNGKKVRLGRVVKNYFETGLVIDKSQLMKEGVPYRHYHFTISDYINYFSEAKFHIEEVVEPDGNKLNKNTNNKGSLYEHTPTFIIFKLIKI